MNGKEKQNVTGSYTKSSHVYSQVSIITHTQHTHTRTQHTHMSVTSIYHRTYITSDHMLIANFINYVREQQLPHTINTSHATPTTHVNWGPMLETDQWRHCLCFKWSGFRTDLEPRPNHLTLNQVLPLGSQ